ncbi:MAG: hypothetical protein HOQ24_15605 [Mycobacteriaceae bacterium]|nr:hypothetical protein [Mycobacteriaceae bacterium]
MVIGRQQWWEQARRTFILAIRKPGKYLFGVSALTAGIVSSLEIAEPARDALDAIPLLTESDWLAYIVTTGVVAVVIKSGSVALRAVVGREPFEVLAAMIDKSGVAPDLTRHFDQLVAGDPELSKPEALDYRSRRVTARELDLLCQLNREVFGLTAFSAPLDVIKRRNRRSFEANPLAYRIIEAKVRGDDFVPVGMSCILPLNQVGEAEYCRTGGLSDAEVSGVHVAGPGEWSDAVVLFSMGLIRTVRGRLRDGSSVLPHVFLEHLVDILTAMRVANPDKSTVRLYAQTEHVKGGIGRMLRRLGFIDTGIVTGDGYPLWELTYDLQSAAAEPLAAESIDAEIRKTASARSRDPESTEPAR